MRSRSEATRNAQQAHDEGVYADELVPGVEGDADLHENGIKAAKHAGAARQTKTGVREERRRHAHRREFLLLDRWSCRAT